ncbi:MAG: F0F1 ATP synthase subunit alpha [bacterium]|nr:F0F1 ATP synthase subunit alpha [bacterium]
MIKTYQDYLKQTGEVGSIEAIVQSIVYVSGLPGVRPKETIVAEGGQRGIVQSLEADLAEVLMLDTANLTTHLSVARTGESFTVAAGEGLLGRVVDAYVRSIDGLGPISGEKKDQPIDPGAPGIVSRVRVERPLETGVSIVDILIPIGYGQRELVIGDKKTGKTTFLLQTIANQAAKGTICIYVSIGKKQDDVKEVENYLKSKNIFNNCVIVGANAADPATMIYLAPYTGMAIAEYFRDSGRDCLIIFDDLSNHAKFYREISLLLKRSPGRGSYPGDIFHIHAALLERAGNITTASGKNVSITALPVAETLEGDITGYIQTNLMAITDGHIFFDIEEFRKGARPAINPATSVSRVGNQTKADLDRGLAQLIREDLSSYQRSLEIARFGVELPAKTRAQIDLGEKIGVIFNQDVTSILPRGLQLVLMGLLLAGYWQGKNASLVKVDVIKIFQKYDKGEFKDIEKQIVTCRSTEDLISLVRTKTSKITEALYV